MWYNSIEIKSEDAMDKDTFTGGVAPGGLTDHTEIKILICFLLCEAGTMTHDGILEALAGHGFANYFECADALSGMEAAGHIIRQDDSYTVTDSGRDIARLLIEDVPLTVRERALQSAHDIVRRTRMQNSHKVGIVETENGFKVRCTVCESSGNEIFALEMDAPSRSAAQHIRDNFVDHAEDIMRYCITKLSGEQL